MNETSISHGTQVIPAVEDKGDGSEVGRRKEIWKDKLESVFQLSIDVEVGKTNR